MNRYLIESPHKPEDCERIIKEVQAAGYLHHFEWGCHDGVHAGWAIVETDNIEHARQMIPWDVRNLARVVKVENFEKVDPLHPHKVKKSQEE